MSVADNGIDSRILDRSEDSRRLGELGFEIAWVSSSNEEVLFVRKSTFV